MKLYTIGFTQKSAEQFFALLQDAGVKRLLDIRLRPGSQLSGFANARDLPFFLNRLIACAYQPLPILAPTAEILDGYRKDHDWPHYVEQFEALMDKRNVPAVLDQAAFAAAASCLLCSEAGPEHCHRRLLAERIARVWPNVEVVHLR